MSQQLINKIASDLSITTKQVATVIELKEEGNTIPFIARYRKEKTGSLDEVQIHSILEKYEYAVNLHTRKDEVIRLIEEKGKLTEDLRKSITLATKLQEVEDLYRPYKEKRRTRATVAKDKGLEPFAEWLFSMPNEGSLADEALKYINVELEVNTVDEVIQGGKDIIAEWIADDATYRKWIREVTFKKGTIDSTVKDSEKDEKKVYEMYYEYSEPISKIVPHRILAMNRAEKEDILKVAIQSPFDEIILYLEKRVITKDTFVRPILMEVVEDAYKRLIQPSIEREIRKELSEKADSHAINIFSENLRSLLLQPPLKGKIVLGVDPAFRTGCKLAVVDETGKVLKIDVIYPHPFRGEREEVQRNKREQAIAKIKDILIKYKIEMIAIGNGTASRETELFISGILKEMKNNTYYVIVNEAGASVYSASELAREEFPDFQVEERSAVSIARRLQDPLAELVKIDPKSVGVGLYQHDVSQKSLNESLSFVVETSVNQVGVNVNTASVSLLQYVSGLSKTVAKNIVNYRDEKGKITNRKELKTIPRLGAKTYEQCIGFLRVLEGDEPLDRTSIHPESYIQVKKLLKQLNFSTSQIGSNELKEQLKTINLKEVSEQLDIGEITLKDILASLMQPERDLRDELAAPILRQDVLQIEDLKIGMELEGTVRNVVDFGAFVDIGLKNDGLVHISRMSSKFIKHPLDVVSVGQVVKVWIAEVDQKKQRVGLSMLPIESKEIVKA
ncbi:Tex family protein [Bacillus sp. AFS029533]|uniref:Tex family protein n=1 Tax=Bacillus sp. AFS029533 TaxID=2033494 RepID=UPI002570EDCD|nr:Tex family protein [Bacillus sp. AFS029533]